MKTSFGSSLPPVVCRSVHVLFTSGAQYMLCWVFMFSIVLCLAYTLLSVSLDSPFFIRFSLTFIISHISIILWWLVLLMVEIGIYEEIVRLPQVTDKVMVYD